MVDTKRAALIALSPGRACEWTYPDRRVRVACLLTMLRLGLSEYLRKKLVQRLEELEAQGHK